MEAVDTAEEPDADRSGSGAVDSAGGRPSVERVSIRLVHVHLPKLAETGVVEYDHDASTVEFNGVSSCEVDSLRRIERIAGELAGAADSTRAS